MCSYIPHSQELKRKIKHERNYENSPELHMQLLFMQETQMIIL